MNCDHRNNLCKRVIHFLRCGKEQARVKGKGTLFPSWCNRPKNSKAKMVGRKDAKAFIFSKRRLSISECLIFYMPIDEGSMVVSF